MYSKVLTLFVLVISVTVSRCGGICGLDNIKKCCLDNALCIKDQELSLRQWYQSPEAASYFIEALDPLVVDKITLEVQHQRVVLKNVTILGILKSELDMTDIHQVVSQYTYCTTATHGVTLNADQSSIIDLSTGIEVIDDKPVRVDLNNAEAWCDLDVKKVTRCDGTSHLNLKINDILVKGGSNHIKTGLKKALNILDKADFGVAIIDQVAKVCSRAIYDNFKTFLTIADYNDFYE